MNAIMPVTISLVMAVVSGAVVWLLWSVIENMGAARRAKHNPPEQMTASEEEPPNAE